MLQDFEIHHFLAPLVVVTRRADGVKGTLEFTHMPRYYFGFQPDGEGEKKRTCSLCGEESTAYTVALTDEDIPLVVCEGCDDGE